MNAAPPASRRPLNLLLRALALLLAGAAFVPCHAQIGGSGWVSKTPSFKVQSPTNAPQSDRYWFTNNIYHCLVFSNDGAFSVGNSTLPRTEQRFLPDYTNGAIQYQATLMAPSNENSYCVFQIHTGDAQSTAFGSTTFMAFWFTNNAGSVHDYSGTTLATNLGNKWFQLNVDHNLVTRTIRVWINQNLVWTQQDNGAGDFYFKDGVYEQSHDPTYQMDTYITNILMWTSTGTNPPAAPTGLTATPTPTQIPLAWNASVGATNYNLKRSTTNGGPYATIASLNGTSFTDTSVSGGITYYYVVTALDEFGESANSTQVSAALSNLGFQLSATPSTTAITAGGSTNYTVTMITNGSFSGTTTFGVAGLPASASSNFNPPSLSTAGTSSLTIHTTTNTPGGTYVLTINGTNGSSVYTTSVTLALQGAAGSPGTLLWTGGNGMNWYTVPNWTNVSGGYGPPGTNNNVIFTNTGATSVPGAVNNVVDSSVSILSLQYSHTNNFHTTQIAAGQTLTIATNLIAGTGTDLGASGTLTAAITGAGGTLSITNSNCVVNVRQGTATSSQPWSQRATLDLSGLDNFNASLGRVLVAGDGGSGGFNSREVGTLYLAKTNTITAAGTAPEIDVADNSSSGAGSSADPGLLTSYLYLGLVNKIFADSITIGRSKCAGVMTFNPAFTVAATPAIYLRGLTANPVATFAVGDDSAVSTSNQREAGTVDWSGGTVDALINTAYVGRSLSGTNAGTGASATGTLTFSAGTVNVNTLEIGYQTSAVDNGPGPVGTVNINGTSLLTVNQTIELAHGHSTSPLEQGTLNLNGGTVQCTNIIGGGGVSAINLNSGVLDLRFTNPKPGQIVNLSTLKVGADGTTDPALLANAAAISASNNIVIAANGTLAGNTFITAPGLFVNGTISPGLNGVGAITNNGLLTLGAGGTMTMKVQNALGASGTGWDFIQASGMLNAQAANNNPFTIQLQSFDPNGSGLVTNFDNNTNYDWVFTTAAGGIANFDPGGLAVDDSLFQNDLAGGYFYVRTNSGAGMVLSFTNNHSPAAATVSLYRAGPVMAIPVASLTNSWSDPDGDPVVLASVNPSSTNGTGNVGTDGAFIYYTNTDAAADQIIYTVQDIRTNPPAVYRSGDTIRAATGKIVLLPPPAIGSVVIQGTNLVLSGANGAAGGSYYVLTSTSVALPMSLWLSVATNSFDSSGSFKFTNPAASDISQAFYRLKLP